MPLDSSVNVPESVPALPGSSGETLPGNGQDSRRRAPAGTENLVNDSNVTHPTQTTHPVQPAFVGEALEDAERLLKYAAEIGVEVDEGVRDSVLRARAAGIGGANDKTVGELLAALTQLAACLKPVTAESLKASHRDTRSTFRTYGIVAMCLAIVVVLFSAASFVTTAISKSISADIVTANELAAKLRAQLGAAPEQNPKSQPPQGLNPIEIITELQQYAATIRAIDSRARQLNRFVFSVQRDPFRQERTDSGVMLKLFQLEVGLPDLWKATDERTQVYQRVRSFAQGVLDDVSIFYGAFIASVLPVLYAVLGTAAYLLRRFEQEMATRTFIPSTANSARFLIAAIGGAVVGLFNYTITQGASIPPLAIAFLVGYAVDVFFAFLEGLVQAFTKRTTPSSS